MDFLDIKDLFIISHKKKTWYMLKINDWYFTFNSHFKTNSKNNNGNTVSNKIKIQAMLKIKLMKSNLKNRVDVNDHS